MTKIAKGECRGKWKSRFRFKLKIKNGLYPDKVSWDIVLALDV